MNTIDHMGVTHCVGYLSTLRGLFQYIVPACYEKYLVLFNLFIILKIKYDNYCCLSDNLRVLLPAGVRSTTASMNSVNTRIKGAQYSKIN